MHESATFGKPAKRGLRPPMTRPRCSSSMWNMDSLELHGELRFVDLPRPHVEIRMPGGDGFEGPVCRRVWKRDAHAARAGSRRRRQRFAVETRTSSASAR
jgi:hypothetical protein